MHSYPELLSLHRNNSTTHKAGVTDVASAFCFLKEDELKVTPVTLAFPIAMNDVNRDRTILHASDIYNSYYEQSNPKKYGKRVDQPSPDMLFAEGLAWEQYFEKVLISNGVPCFRPGEQTIEWKGKKLAFSPDLILVEGEDAHGGSWRDGIGEIKKKWSSSRLVPTDKEFAKFKTQGCMYGHFMGIQRITWFIDHTVGNWRDYTFPQLKIWEIEFTKREMRDEVTAMMRHAENEGLFAKAEAGLL